MAKCDEGYLCDVCGREVSEITESDLYLRYVIGEVSLQDLSRSPERHITCNPVQAQFIVAEGYPAVSVEGPFDKRQIDQEDVRTRESLVTRGWLRLREIASSNIPLPEYPLPEIRTPAGNDCN